MYRIAALLVLASGCSSEDTCGTLTLELAEDSTAYPASLDTQCDIRKGGVWDKVKNDATIVFTDPSLPEDAYISAHLPLAMVKQGAMLVVPTGVAGEAYTKNQTNHANLTGGMVTIEKYVGEDRKVTAQVFEVSYQLEWLGTGTYHASGSAQVWFVANHGL